MYLSHDRSTHIYIKTFTKQDLAMYGYQYVLYNNMQFTAYPLSYKGAAGKAFSAYMPAYITFFWLTNSQR
jgi:hypothetical protein